MVHLQVVEQFADALAVAVGADGADQAHVGVEGAQHGRDAARAAEALLAPVGPQQDDRGFLADPLGVAPDVPVEHDVADDQHPGPAEVLHEIDQVGGHQAPRETVDDVRRAATAAWRSGINSSWWPMISIPWALGRLKTFIRVRYLPSLSRLAVTSPDRSAPKLRATAIAFKNTSGMITALPMFNQSPSCIPWTTRQRMRKSISDDSPVAAPETWGCMWTISVPMATCIVHGIPARRAVRTRLASACGQRMSSMYCPSAAPRPIALSLPIRAAAANASAVSRAMPKCPPTSWAATSSLVLPARASSKSWIAADPFMATA